MLRFRLLIGIPGKSNAFAISSKLGLSDEIINAAKEQISKEDESFEDVIADLEQSRVTIEKEQQEIAEYKERIRTLQEQLQKKNEKIDQAKDKILRDANEKARAILQEAKDVADETIRDFNKAGASADIKELEKLVNEKDAVLCKIQRIIPQLDLSTIQGSQHITSIEDIINRPPLDTLKEAFAIRHNAPMNERQEKMLSDLLTTSSL